MNRGAVGGADGMRGGASVCIAVALAVIVCADALAQGSPQSATTPPASAQQGSPPQSATTPPASAQQGSPPQSAPQERTEIKAPEGDPLAPLAWLEGCWRGTAGPREFHEHWLPQRGSVMIGASQTVVQNKTQNYEYLRLEAKPDGVHYVVTPSGKSEVSFRLAEAALDRGEGRSDEYFVFVDPTHDFPRKITYRRASQGWLYATLEGKVEGQDRQLVYPLRRVGCESGEFIRG